MPSWASRSNKKSSSFCHTSPSTKKDNVQLLLFATASLEPTYRQLQSMKLDRSPFVIISVVGQELLAQGKFASAVDVLESALKIGTCSLKLRGSVFSALSSAYWALNNLDKVSDPTSIGGIISMPKRGLFCR